MGLVVLDMLGLEHTESPSPVSALDRKDKTEQVSALQPRSSKSTSIPTSNLLLEYEIYYTIYYTIYVRLLDGGPEHPVPKDHEGSQQVQTSSYKTTAALFT